eukprot:110812_1
MSTLNLVDCLIEHFTNGSISFDISKSVSVKCNGLDKGCVQAFRVMNAMKYYSLLNGPNYYGINGNDHKNKLVEFVNHTYRSLLNDFIHVTQYHNNELNYILAAMINNHSMSECNIRNCPFFSRCYRNRSINVIETDNDFMFCRNLLDSIHCYLFHSYDIGLRTNGNGFGHSRDILKADHDTKFANIQRIIQEQTIKLPTKYHFSERFANNKFNLNLNVQQMIDLATNNDNTCIDSLYKHINDRHYSKYLSTLHKFLVDQEYDTDALLYDTDGYEECSNVALVLNVNDIHNPKPILILPTHLNLVCTCGELLILWKVKDCYSGKQVVCDWCNDEFIEGEIYHCVNAKNAQVHLNGFDVCLQCSVILESKRNVAAHQVTPYNILKQYLKQIKLSQYSFSIGFRFYYWNYYKQNKVTTQLQLPENRYDHCGYETYELYIDAKYKSIKQEILNNKHHQL